MGPKESGYLNGIDGFNVKPNLQWIYFENQYENVSLLTKDFNI